LGPRPRTSSPFLGASETAPALPAPEAGELQTLLLAPDLLAELERRGLDFSSLASGTAATDNAALAKSSAWQSVREVLAADVTAIAASDPRAGVAVARLSHRLFDVRFFDAPGARFVLIGVTARLDRRPFESSSCGETRLVYRLAYDAPALGTRSALPATVAFEFASDPRDRDGSCRSASAAWFVPASADAATSSPAFTYWAKSAKKLLPAPPWPRPFLHTCRPSSNDARRS